MSLETIQKRLSEVKQFLLTNNGNLNSLEERLNGVQNTEGKAGNESPTPDKGIIGDISEQVEALYTMLSAQKEMINKLNYTVYGIVTDEQKRRFTTVTEHGKEDSYGGTIGVSGYGGVKEY